jgi:hypothetical protein
MQREGDDCAAKGGDIYGWSTAQNWQQLRRREVSGADAAAVATGWGGGKWWRRDKCENVL